MTLGCAHSTQLGQRAKEVYYKEYMRETDKETAGSRHDDKETDCSDKADREGLSRLALRVPNGCRP
jgi:hypothetical protein